MQIAHFKSPFKSQHLPKSADYPWLNLKSDIQLGSIVFSVWFDILDLHILFFQICSIICSCLFVIRYLCLLCTCSSICSRSVLEYPYLYDSHHLSFHIFLLRLSWKTALNQPIHLYFSQWYPLFLFLPFYLFYFLISKYILRPSMLLSKMRFLSFLYSPL